MIARFLCLRANLIVVAKLVSAWEIRAIQLNFGSARSIRFRLAEREGFEPSVTFWATFP